MEQRTFNIVKMIWRFDVGYRASDNINTIPVCIVIGWNTMVRIRWLKKKTNKKRFCTITAIVQQTPKWNMQTEGKKANCFGHWMCDANQISNCVSVWTERETGRERERERETGKVWWKWWKIRKYSMYKESITWGTDSNSMHLKWFQPLLKQTQMRTIVNDTKGNFLLKLFSAIVHFSIELHFLGEYAVHTLCWPICWCYLQNHQHFISAITQHLLDQPLLPVQIQPHKQFRIGKLFKMQAK